MTAVTVLGSVALLLLIPLAVTAVRQRTLVTMAVRNISRRRSEALLVVGGAMLGTAIITSSLVVGDVMEGSLTDVARTRYGPVDLTVTLPGGTALDDVASAIQDAHIDDVEALLPATTDTATLAAPLRETAVPRLRVVELDLPAARAFGADRRSTGLADTGALGAEEVLVNARVAERLDVAAGDPVRLHAYGAAVDLIVADVVDEVGLAGYGEAIVAPGTMEDLVGAGTAGVSAPRAQLLVSLVGGVLDTRALSDAAEADLREAIAHLPGVEVAAVKATVLDDAERDGAALTELFATVGSFSVLAGILLLVNLFVMLAEERKTELGMLRALGFTRRRLARAFAIEGAVYALAATALGTVVGVGIGWLVAVLAGALFATGSQGFDAPLVVEPVSLAIGGLMGLVVALSAIWGTSTRIARLNVIRAIRDLPEPRARRVGRRTLVLGAIGVLVGAAVSTAGYLAEDAVPLLLGVPVAAFSAAALLPRVLPDRVARLLVAGTVLGWGLAALPLFPEIMAGLDEAIFVVQGVVLTAGAVSLAVSLDRVWSVAIERLGRAGRGLGARLGVAYPLARRFRTSMLLAMFSLVIFTVTIIAAVTVTFERSIDQLVADVAGGYDVILDTNPSDPVDVRTLVARGDVEAVAGLTHGVASFAAEHLDSVRVSPITGFDADLLARGGPTLFRRDEAYASDDAVYRAVLADPTLAIVPDGFLVTDMATSVLDVGDTFAVVDPSSGEARELTIAGLGQMDWIGNGALVSREVTAGLFGPRDVVARSYLAVPDGADPGAVAADLDAAFLSHGAEAVTFTALGTEGMRQQLGFMALVQGFLGLGLLVGIAGLAVVMVRAVRERRQEIGMLRAMGFRTGLVRAALLFEAGLIAVQGTAIGAVLGLITTRQLLSGAEAFGDGDLAFHVPWAALAVIIALPLAAALAATAWPASRAAAIRPAVALRTAG